MNNKKKKKITALFRENTKGTLYNTETIPCVAVKLEDGVGEIIPKLKPVLVSGKIKVKIRDKAKVQHKYSTL
jgi:hypothetical protein